MVNIEAVQVKDPNGKLKDNSPEWAPRKYHTLSIIGSRTKGKTNLMVWMLLTGGLAKCYEQVVILSPSITFDKTWRALDKYENISTSSDCTGEILEAILTLQKQRWSQRKKSDKRPPDTLLVIDDFGPVARTGDVKKVLEKLYATARHFGLSLWFSVQAAMMLSPVMRLNSTNVILFRLNLKEYRKLSEEWRCHLSEQDFISRCLDATREKYHFLYINLQTNEQERIFNEGF